MLDHLEKQGASRAEDEKQEELQNHVRCEACGATVVFVDTLTSLECPYCGSPMQREHIHTGGWRIPVDGVLAFAIVRERAADNFSGWIRCRWFAPNDFVERAESGKFNGVYLPFWTYDAITASRYEGQRGDHYWEEVGSGNEPAARCGLAGGLRLGTIPTGFRRHPRPRDDRYAPRPGRRPQSLAAQKVHALHAGSAGRIPVPHVRRRTGSRL